MDPRSTPRSCLYIAKWSASRQLGFLSLLCSFDGGFVKTATYDKRLLLSKGLTLEVYKHGKDERVGIKFIEVTVE